MKRIALTIIMIVVLTSTAVQARNFCGPRVVYLSPPRFHQGPVRIVHLSPRVVHLGRGYGYYGQGHIGRTSTAKGIAVAQTVFDGLSLLMEHQQIDKDREHEIRVINTQQAIETKQVIKEEQRQEELARLQHEIEKAKLQKELEQLKKQGN